ncbi:MAG: ABC transporter ATP-binding protein [Desulfobacteraceae bacterium]|nr:ABC transporter ATP-binding protein [Desulfobacteraceae bacterium]
MLILSNVEVMYSNVILVLKGVSLAVKEGKIIVLLGANGAGKTTTLKAISGLLYTETGEVTDGDITFEGRTIKGVSPHKIVNQGIVQVQEGRRIFEHFIVEEELKVGAYVSSKGTTVKEGLEMIYTYFPRLKSLRRNTCGFLSGGEQQMLVMGRALITHPKLMLLDEPSLGLSPLLVEEIFRIIQRINKEEKTSILLVEQNAMASLMIAQYGYVMENGRIVMDGPADKLRDNEDIKEFYLGLSEVGQKKSYQDIKHYKRRKRWLA